jgi:class 3 adenylate cyclase
MERKLTAMLCADVYGYSRLMGEDEEVTLHTLTSHRKLIDSAIEQHHGRSVIEVAEAGGVDSLEGEVKIRLKEFRRGSR